jgi:2-C-methyl-D-erythritol 4-phosphate cytidylyltransferase/2-C-methyl-D-erythritol 2,4-cyclodiphosphate synthase
MTTSAVIVAAGRGERMRSGTRKALLDLAGRPLLSHAVAAFFRVPRIAEIVAVVHPDDLGAARDAVALIGRDVRFVAGGATRRESSLAGIRAATGDTVLIHDGCRPFVTAALIDRVLDGVERHGAVVPVLPSTETLYLRDVVGRRLSAVVDRASIARAQTPQGFRRSLILRCLEAADPAVTDDASAVLAQGEPVFTVEGEAANLKVTHPEDLRWAEAFADRPA